MGKNPLGNLAGNPAGNSVGNLVGNSVGNLVGNPAGNSAGARSKNSATNHSTFQKKSELFSIGGGHVVPVVNNTTCFSIYKWLLFLLLFSSYFPLLSHSFLK